jgi:hypothetical protein
VDPRTNSATEQPQDAILTDLRAARDHAYALYRRETHSMVHYVRSGARTVVARFASPSRDDPLEQQDPTSFATTTCFAAVQLVAFALTPGTTNASPLHGESFVGTHSQGVLDTIVADFESQYEYGKDGLTNRQPPSAKLTSDPPNPYSTPLHLCGLAAALGHLSGKDRVRTSVVDLGFVAAHQVAQWLSAGNGFIPHGGIGAPTENHTPDAYLTYWCVRGIVNWLDAAERLDGVEKASPSDDDRRKDRAAQTRAASAALAVGLEAHLNYLSRILVAHHAGIGSTFDADDIVCMIAAVAIASRRLGRRGEFIDVVIPHAVDVLLDGFVHSDGSFVPNAPVLEPLQGDPLIIASTEELNAILLHAVGPELTVRQALGLRKALDHAERKAGGPQGWGSDAEGSAERRDAYVSSAALSFLLSYHAVLERLIAQHCAAELGVEVVEMNIDRFTLPKPVQDVVGTDIMPLILEPGRRNLAVTSLVLGGPRSAPKEKIARKIAYLLDWPILTFDPVSFLGDENSGLDLEIRRNLDLLSELSDTVVFFDALDDWLRAPSNSAARRILSWSMLSRLDQLTATGRILLVIACEDPMKLGLSKDRAGRLDTVVVLGPPDLNERRALLKQYYDSFGAAPNVLRAFEDARVAETSEGFTDGHLRELVREVVVKALSARITRKDVTAAAAALKTRISEGSVDG